MEAVRRTLPLGAALGASVLAVVQACLLPTGTLLRNTSLVDWPVTVATLVTGVVVLALWTRSARATAIGAAAGLLGALVMARAIALATVFLYPTGLTSTMTIVSALAVLTVATAAAIAWPRLTWARRSYMCLVAVLVAVGLWQRERLVAIAWADLGALSQAQTELAGYSTPDRLPETVRRTDRTVCGASARHHAGGHRALLASPRRSS